MITPFPRLVRPDDAHYYRGRAIQEQIAAQKATCVQARNSHDQLAAMYRFRALMMSDGPLPEGVAVGARIAEAVS